MIYDPTLGPGRSRQFADVFRDELCGCGQFAERTQMNATEDKSVDDGKAIAAEPIGRLQRTVSSRELLRGERLLIIKHEEEIYRLQLTAAGKLILTK
jgi:hemin uptake protein HemP